MLLGKNKLPYWLSIFLFAACSITNGYSAYGASHHSAAAATTSSDDQIQLRAEAANYEKQFAAGDAKAIAAMCSPDCVYIDADGLEYHGRDQIEQTYSDYFKNGGAKTIHVAIESITFPSPDVAIEQGTTTSPSDTGSGTADKYMVVHLKRDGKWQMYRVTETNCQPAPCPSKLKDLGWMVGDWTATGANQSLHMNAKYTNGDHFIHYTFAPSDTASSTEQEIVAWDPRVQRIVSWHYGANGGFGRALWRETPQGWTKRAFTIEADGTRGAATYVIEKVDDNTFLWRSIQRSLNGQQLPDTTEVKVTRDQRQGS